MIYKCTLLLLGTVLLAAAACEQAPTLGRSQAGPNLATSVYYVCYNQVIPSGYVILSGTSYNSGCGGARYQIGIPGSAEYICQSSAVPIPSGYVVTSLSTTSTCVSNNLSYNRLYIKIPTATQETICNLTVVPIPSGYAFVRYTNTSSCSGASSGSYNALVIAKV